MGFIRQVRDESHKAGYEKGYEEGYKTGMEDAANGKT